MAASRCITSLLQFPLRRSNSTYFSSVRLSAGYSTRNHEIDSKTPPFRHLSAPQFRFLSQKVTDESSAPPSTDKINILGSLKGLGIAEDVLKKPNDGTNEDQAKPMFDQEDEEKRRKEDEASWRTLKYSMIFMGVTTAGLAGFLVGSWGAPDVDEEGNVVHDQFSDKQIIIQYLMRSLNAVMNYSQMIKDPSRDKLLPDPLKEPYIQPPYTLVLEMTGVLVHPDWTYQTGWRFKKRPGIDFFLSQVGPPTFEVVIYTAEQAFTAFPIIDALDPNGYIMYRLFRDATRYEDGHHVKDLDCINRDLSKVIVIDWNEKSVKSHQRNALKLKQWKGNDDDRYLIDLALLLKTIATSEVEDVRTVIDFYNQFDDPIEAFRENQRKLQEQQELMDRMNQEKLTRPPSLARNLFRSRF